MQPKPLTPLTPLTPIDDDTEPDSLGFALTNTQGMVIDVVIHHHQNQNQNHKWLDVFTPALKDKCTVIIADALRQEGREASTVAVLLTDDDTIAQLNKNYKAQNKPTDVLSFPNHDEDGFLGDIALAYGFIARQASALKIPLSDHVLHLMLHGVLHLSGHDHTHHHDAVHMEKIEIDILAKHGIPNPYAGTEKEASAI